jgi:hypothetical protein
VVRKQNAAAEHNSLNRAYVKVSAQTRTEAHEATIRDIGSQFRTPGVHQFRQNNVLSPVSFAEGPQVQGHAALAEQQLEQGRGEVPRKRELEAH